MLKSSLRNTVFPANGLDLEPQKPNKTEYLNLINYKIMRIIKGEFIHSLQNWNKLSTLMLERINSGTEFCARRMIGFL